MVSSIGGKSGSNLLGNLNKANNDQKNSYNKLSSGSRITSAKDDAAGLAILKALEAENSALGQAVRNNRDTVSALQIAESAAGQLNDIGTRMKELAMQSSNGVLSDTQRTALSTEFNALREEAGRIVETTEFNDTKLLQGDSITAQIGADGSASSQITVDGVDGSNLVSSISSLDISTQAGAQAALEPMDDFSSSVTQSRGNLGAATSRLQTSEQNTESMRVANEAAASQIRDVDVAQEVANLTSANIRADVGTALAAHQNNSASRILDLLK